MLKFKDVYIKEIDNCSDLNNFNMDMGIINDCFCKLLQNAPQECSNNQPKGRADYSSMEMFMIYYDRKTGVHVICVLNNLACASKALYIMKALKCKPSA